MSTPPPLSHTSMTSNQDRLIAAPRPIRTTPNLVTRVEDLSQPWTRSPTKAQMEPVVATWRFMPSDPPHTGSSVVGKSPKPQSMFGSKSWEEREREAQNLKR